MIKENKKTYNDSICNISKFNGEIMSSLFCDLNNIEFIENRGDTKKCIELVYRFICFLISKKVDYNGESFTFFNTVQIRLVNINKSSLHYQNVFSVSDYGIKFIDTDETKTFEKYSINGDVLHFCRELAWLVKNAYIMQSSYALDDEVIKIPNNINIWTNVINCLTTQEEIDEFDKIINQKISEALTNLEYEYYDENASESEEESEEESDDERQEDSDDETEENINEIPLHDDENHEESDDETEENINETPLHNNKHDRITVTESERKISSAEYLYNCDKFKKYLEILKSAPLPPVMTNKRIFRGKNIKKHTKN